VALSKNKKKSSLSAPFTIHFVGSSRAFSSLHS